MAWSFRKRIKIIPGVHLNFSKKGISTSIGVRGASVTFGQSGTHVNTSIPGLGLAYRAKLGSGQPIHAAEDATPVGEHLNFGNIFSADVHEITSQNMQGIKEAILLARQQKSELRSDLSGIKRALVTTQIKLGFAYVFLYGLINKSIAQSLKEDIAHQKEAIVQTGWQIDNCHVKLEVDFDAEIRLKYQAMLDAFVRMSNSQQIWDVTSSHYQNRAVTRSAASTLVSKRNVHFSVKPLAGVLSAFEALYFQNANGADLYFYPGFIVMSSSKDEFAVIGFEELNLVQHSVRFVETGSVPKDSKVIDRTWARVNKNGSPDKRFKGNYQIPIVNYGEISLKTSTGLNEAYHFSNYQACVDFGLAFKEYQNAIADRSPSSRNPLAQALI